MTDKRNSTQMDRFTAAFEEAVGNAIHTENIPTLVAALEMVDMAQKHLDSLRADGEDVSMTPVYAALTMLGTITRGMVPTTNQTELGLLSADYRKSQKNLSLTGNALHSERMRKADFAMQNILANMWKGCK